MTTWTSDELNKIGTAEELQIASLRQGWHTAKAGDHLGRPPRGRPLCPICEWTRTLRGSVVFRRGYEGHIRAGGVDKDVTFVEETDSDINDQIDTAYTTKYRRYASIAKSMVTPAVRAATIKIIPR